MIDFLVPIGPPTIILAVFGLILTRRILVSLASSVSQFSTGWENAENVEALMFDEGKLERNDGKRDYLLWDLLAPGARAQWLAGLVGGILKRPCAYLGVERFINSTNGVAVLVPRLQDAHTGEVIRPLVKVFATNASHKAINDSTLCRECRSLEILPSFLGQSSVQEHFCQVFSCEDLAEAPLMSYGAVLQRVTMEAASYVIPGTLVETYRVSHSCLPERLDEGMLDRLEAVATDEQLLVMQKVRTKFASVKAQLGRMPLALAFALTARSAVSSGERNELKLYFWQSWAIEPIGYGWRTATDDIDKLTAWTEEVKAKRADLRDVKVEAVILAALVSEFEKLYRRADYVSCIGTIEEAMKWAD